MGSGVKIIISRTVWWEKLKYIGSIVRWCRFKLNSGVEWVHNWESKLYIVIDSENLRKHFQLSFGQKSWSWCGSSLRWCRSKGSRFTIVIKVSDVSHGLLVCVFNIFWIIAKNIGYTVNVCICKLLKIEQKYSPI